MFVLTLFIIAGGCNSEEKNKPSGNTELRARQPLNPGHFRPAAPDRSSQSR